MMSRISVMRMASGVLKHTALCADCKHHYELDDLRVLFVETPVREIRRFRTLALCPTCRIIRIDRYDRAGGRVIASESMRGMSTLGLKRRLMQWLTKS